MLSETFFVLWEMLFWIFILGKKTEIMICYPAVFLTKNAYLFFIRSLCEKELILKVIYPSFPKIGNHLFLVSFIEIVCNLQRVLKHWPVFNAISIQKFTINSQLLSFRMGAKQLKTNNI